MKYTRAFIDAIGYELAPVVVSSAEIEEQLAPVFAKLRIPHGQLEAWTGIRERRWWEPNFPLSRGAAMAGRKALLASNVRPDQVQALLYAGVCREQFEPATACRVASELGIGPDAMVYDISNACLGVLNGIVELANRIELGQIRAGMVVSCESAREINQIMIQRLQTETSMSNLTKGLATLTGGSGAVAVLVTDGSFGQAQRRRLMGGVSCTAPQFHDLCRWGIETLSPAGLRQFMSTDSIAVLRHGIELGGRTWRTFLENFAWAHDSITKVICHQVGAEHRDQILKALRVPKTKDFSTFPFLGNIGTVSLPLTAAVAEQRGFLSPGDRVGFLGIGSGLNCLMLGLQW